MIKSTEMMSWKKVITLISLLLFSIVYVFAQNVGIGTATPSRKLSVSGSIVVDHDSTSNGALDSASLLFGSGARAGISSNKNPLMPNFRGMDLWTNGLKRISVLSNGNVGIGTDAPSFKLQVNGSLYSHNNFYANQNAYISNSLEVDDYVAIAGAINSNYRLNVNNGNSRFGGNVQVTGNLSGQSLESGSTLRVTDYAAIGGNLDNNYRLRVYDGNARIGGDFHATGNAAIGGAVDNNFRLRVYDGNSRFGGDVQVTGNLNTGSMEVGSTLTIGGNGSVRSNGSSPLRIGFDKKYVNFFLANNDNAFVYTDITDFSGDWDDVRVVVSQIEGDVAASVPWDKIGVMVTGIDAANDRCVLRFHNRSGAGGMVVGTIYLMTVAKN